MKGQGHSEFQFRVDEQEFERHCNYFICTVREKYPIGFSFLKGFQTTSSSSGETEYQVTFSEPMVFLLNYLGSEYSGRPEMRDEVFARIIQHLITHGYN